MHDEPFSVNLDLRDDFTFAVDFGLEGVPELLVDEPPPLGSGSGPNASRLLASAIGNCLGASLLFCLKKSHVDVTDLAVAVEGRIVRNEAGRLRIEGVRVRLEPTVAAGQEHRLGRCAELFEDFCTVTASVRQGIDVDVELTTPSVAGV